MTSAATTVATTPAAKKSRAARKFASKSAVKKPAPLWLDSRLKPLGFDLPGPFVRLKNGAIMTVDSRGTLVSKDQGKTWNAQPLFDYQRNDKEYKISNERVLMRSREGVLVLSFMNLNEKVWGWRSALDILPETRLPHYAVRSVDEGKTWQDVTMLHEQWTGEIRNVIQTASGRLIISSMRLLTKPGRHSVLTYGSDDQGKTWQASNVIDLGGVGHHGGVTEAPIVQLKDGRIWMLLRTNWGFLWQAFSSDEGRSWREIGPTTIAASSAPALVTRLASGRLLLLWNRPFPEGKTTWPLTGGDNNWSETAVSNHRTELSLALSEDEGKSFSKPVVVARRANSWLSYPRIFEAKPGQLWLTTMQGGLCLELAEKDFV